MNKASAAADASRDRKWKYYTRQGSETGTQSWSIMTNAKHQISTSEADKIIIVRSK